MGLERKPAFGARILLIEPDDATRKLLERVIRDEGYVVTAVAGGHQAMSRVVAKRQPDLVIMDLSLPIVSAETTAITLRHHYGHTLPVLAVSTGQERAAEGRRLRAYAVLDIPRQIADLPAEIARGLET